MPHYFVPVMYFSFSGYHFLKSVVSSVGYFFSCLIVASEFLGFFWWGKEYFFSISLDIKQADAVILLYSTIFSECHILGYYFILIYYFDIITHSQEVAKIVDRGPLYPSLSFPQR